MVMTSAASPQPQVDAYAPPGLLLLAFRRAAIRLLKPRRLGYLLASETLSC